MSLSGQLWKVSTQVAELEVSLEAIRTGDDARVEERKADLRQKIRAGRIKLGNALVDAGSQSESDWTDEKVAISEAFDGLKRLRVTHYERPRVTGDAHSGQSEPKADIDDVEFAIYVIQEAEYAILDAISIVSGRASG